MNRELEHILFLVKQSNPSNVVDVQRVVEDYFRPIVWSILKEEYEVRMTERERQLFLVKLFNDTRGDNSHEAR